MAKIDYSQLEKQGKFNVTFDDGKIAQYMVYGYSGSYIGCFSSYLTGITISGGFYDAYRGTYAACTNKWDITPDLVEAVYKYLIRSILGTTFVVMGDAINWGSQWKPIKRDTQITIASTFEFVEYLLKHKIGTIYASPIGRNANHTGAGNFSLCQVWIWIPPHRQDWIIPGSARIFNEHKGTRESWVKAVNDYLPHYPNAPKPDMTWDDMVAKTMLPESEHFKAILE